ncbi:MAG: hypothetical protein LKJ90_00190 [Faecalibacterium sp.]|jgi:hypothetical protein|nr:hypothetical protein [Faecalibacterium sp.]
MQDENFNPVAQSRANYYTPGSPIQFVRVELLRGEESGSNAVCLTFKNIGPDTLTGLKVHFKCKNAQGETLCEDSYSYEELDAGTGDVFGMDDAVFVTEQAIGSVDVVLSRAFFGRRSEALEQYKRVRLPAPKRLPRELAAQLQNQIGRKELKYMPQVLENGWYCACGAFHPNEENTVYCSECGSDRILLQNALSSLMEPENAVDEPTRVAPGAVDEEPTRVMNQTHTAAPHARDDGNTREIDRRAYRGEEDERFADASRKRGRDASANEEMDPRDAKAEVILRWVPAATALVCAMIAFGGFFYCQFLLK